MAINGILFDNQSPTAKGLRGGFHSALSDGILEGCNISYSGGTLTIGSGLVHAAGGIFSIAGGETIAISGTSGYERIIINIDLSQTSTAETFNQVSITHDHATATNTFTNLTKQNINAGGGTIYQAELCVVSLGGNGITGVVRKAIASAKIQYGNTLPADAPEGTIFLLKVT